MSRAEELYQLDKRIDSELRKIKDDKYNSETLRKYYYVRVAEGVSKSRICKCLNTLRQVSTDIGKPFEDVTKDDLIKFVADLERKDWSDWTKRDFKIIIKKFWKSFKDWDDYGYPPEVRWIKDKKNLQSKHPILPKNLLTYDEKIALLNATQNPRDRALLEIFFESGRRPEEVLTLHIGDIEFDSTGAKLWVHGKKGEDFVRIITSVPALTTWLNIHPRSDETDAPLWVGFGRSNRNKQIDYNASYRLIKKIAARAGIKKRVFKYLFRHTKADEILDKLNEPQQCLVMGWQFGSKMPRTYMKRYGRHIDKAVRTLNGVKEPEENIQQITSIECFRCSIQNSPVSKFCYRCGAFLNVKNSVALDQKKQKLDQLLYGIASDSEKMEKLKNALTEICNPKTASNKKDSQKQFDLLLQKIEDV
ncbi:hypothetical protein C6990_05445 [Nitrosopumilus sp. b3]|uniref:site-specific integrase n=1 Tax=Nitrosopumilus sp. b3 TaxID=2109909 RepID=UPI0015F3B6EE|nr:tyrosine-type recombinase/integrase [Nitrosopumilus sp. b3]KAF6247126.1 hypothetical protein C6990_05445 [Nitrosopumilus sp. b3]